MSKLLAADAKREKVLLLDPRPPGEFRAERLPGAVNLNLPAVAEDKVDPMLDGYSVLVVYGRDPGSVSARAMTKRLMASGYDDVRFFVGGIEEWKGSGGKVERDQAPAGKP